MPAFVLPPQNNDSPFADMRGHHVAIRASSLEEVKDFYVGKLDFRVVVEWNYEDEKLAYLVPPGMIIGTSRCLAAAIHSPRKYAL